MSFFCWDCMEELEELDDHPDDHEVVEQPEDGEPLGDFTEW